MNEHPERTEWTGHPQERMPVALPNGGREMWQPPPGYPPEDNVYGQPESGNFVHDLQNYFWILFRHRWVVLGTALVFVCIGLLVTFLSTPIYRASATIQIDREPAKILGLEQVQADIGSDAAFYATQYEILKSRSLAEEIVSNFTGDELKSFTEQKALAPWVKLWQAVKKVIRPDNSAEADEGADVAALQRAASSRLLGNLSVEPVGTSRIVALSFESPDPEWAQRIANAVANTFLSLTLQRRFDASSYARSFLQDRLKELKVKLEDSEAQLVAYAQKEKIVNVDERKSLIDSNLTTLSSQLSDATRQRMKSEQLLKQADATDGLALPQVLNDDSVRKMREQRASLAAQYQDQLSFFKPAYPEMLKLKAQIDEIDRQIASSVTVVKESLRADYEASKAQEEALQEELEKTKTEALDLDSRGIQYRILQREVDTNRQLYDGLLQRFKEVGVAGADSTNNVSIVDAAVRPGQPFEPSLSKNLVIALAFGLFCGGAAAFGIEFLDDTFKVPEDVEGGLGLPVLGIIPMLETAEELSEALANPRSSVSEAYRSLRTTLQFSTADGAPKTLLVTSARPREGKSTTVAALARNFAQLGQRVLLIDADLRNPSLHKVLGLPANAGLSNYLTGNVMPSGVFQRTDQPGLTLMASGRIPPNPAELLAGPKMGSLLAVASEKFDIVIIDGPPVMGIADALLLGSIAGGTLLVVEAGQTRRGITKGALKRLHFARANMVGALLSKFNARNVGHTYGYGYGYGYGYYGYGESDYYGYGSDTPQIEESAPSPPVETKQPEAG